MRRYGAWIAACWVGALGCGDGEGAADASPGAADAAPTLEQVRWSVPMQFGFEGSPALCDLDGDGALEGIVPLTSFFGDTAPDAYMVIVEAASGTVRAESPQGVGGFAYPFCLDVDGDGVKDVITGGRFGDVDALSGVTGARLWSLAERNPDALAGDTYTTVAEADTPGVLFVTNGGGGNPEVVRPDVPGQLIAYDATGAIRARWPEPDEAEIYASAAVARGPAPDAELLVAVGSGGERLAGSLHLVRYDEAGERFTTLWSVPSACAGGGFVASPVFGDLTGDGVPEVVGVDYCGTVHVVALDGTELWTYLSDISFPTANPLLADLDGDGVLDVVAVFESLNFSFYGDTSDDPRSAVIALRGTSGAVLWQQVVANLVFAGPVSADFDGDGTEDVWLLRSAVPLGEVPALEVRSGRDGDLLASLAIGNTSGTPVLGDFDGNGAIDLLMTDLRGPREPGVIVRLEFDGVSFAAAESYSGFRGVAAHDGYRR